MAKYVWKNIIRSADDFGLNGKANSNILRAAEGGKLDRVSVMMFGRFTSEEIERLKKSGVKLDVHLHLERLKADSFQNNGAHQGIGKRIILFVKLLFSNGGSKVAQKEWSEQLTEFQKVIGRLPDGLTSHEHIHFFPLYFKVAAGFKDKYVLSYFRVGKKGARVFSLVSLILNSLRWIDKAFLKKNLDRFPTSDYFLSFDWIPPGSDFFKYIPTDGTVEIVFHPERDEELEFLMKN
jgi:predicted glycoside hydrolase/deacetylase ChbG (UPF0249 family)